MYRDMMLWMEDESSLIVIGYTANQLSTSLLMIESVFGEESKPV
jgi:hypothetical protein